VALQKAMAERLGVEIEQSTAPFQDYLTGETGTGCQLVATGTGQDFPHFVEVAADLGKYRLDLGRLRGGLFALTVETPYNGQASIVKTSSRR
jgi:hypothetical protein